MAEAENHYSLPSKRKAITALLSYAVWQERDGKPEMLDMILRIARASRILGFMWYCLNRFVATLLSQANLRAIILVSPHIHWYSLDNRGDLVQWWAEKASVALHTKEVDQDVVGQDVVRTLLRIATEARLVRYIPVNVWSWLTKLPSLPPICTGGCFGTRAHTVKAVRELKDIEILKSYLLLVWSEWNNLYLDGYAEMCTLIGEDFGGIGMGHHRADLIRRLDHIHGQLDRGLEYVRQHCPGSDDDYLMNHCPKLKEDDLRQHWPGLDEDFLRIRKSQYRELRETLLEINSRTPRLTIMFLRVLTHTPGTCRIPHNIYVCTPSPMPIVS